MSKNFKKVIDWIFTASFLGLALYQMFQLMPHNQAVLVSFALLYAARSFADSLKP